MNAFCSLATDNLKSTGVFKMFRPFSVLDCVQYITVTQSACTYYGLIQNITVMIISKSCVDDLL